MNGSGTKPPSVAAQTRAACGVLAFLILSGTLAFKIAGGPGWSLLDAFFMTVTTLTTVGYGEVHPLGSGGKWVAIFISLGGVGTALYIIGSFAEAVIEGRLFWRRRVMRRVKRLSEHYIVCGSGRVGRAICHELEAQGTPYVVIELIEAEPGDETPRLVGDATDDAVLERAGVHRAKALVTALGSDAENIYAVLAARALNPKLFIVARCSQERSARKLEAAGANRVVNPYERGGSIIAQIMLRPKVVDFIEGISRGAGFDVNLEQLAVASSSPLVGTTLRESPIRRDLDIIVTAIAKASGEHTFNPSPDSVIEAGDVLIAMGRPEALDALARRTAGYEEGAQ